MNTKEFLNGLASSISEEVLAEKETLFHFDLAGDEGGQYTVAIKDGKMAVSEGLEGEARCVVRGKGKHFISVVQGEMKPLMALMLGKIKVSNQGEMMKYAKVFGLM